MPPTNSGTINLGGKTYNISQINSVYIGNTPRYGGKVWGIYFLCGILGAVAMQKPELWAFLTTAATLAAVYFNSKQDYEVFFDMSSGKVAAFSDQSKEKVMWIQQDIIKGMEEGEYPSYLQGKN